MPKYVVITPVHNEQELFNYTADSLIKQTILPVEWMVVDDGSTDRTPQLIQSYQKKANWIKSIRLNTSTQRELGARVIQAFWKGYEALTIKDYDFIAKMDADLSLPEDYFEKLFQEFQKDNSLGLASGKTFLIKNKQHILERCPDWHVRGPLKLYKSQCFEEIGGPLPILGWDILDECKARKLGWKTRSFISLPIIHHRRMGSQGGMLNGRLRTGRAMYTIRAHPVFVFGKALYRMTEYPIILGGLAIIAGYFRSAFRKDKKLTDPELIKYLRKEQLSRFLPKRWSEERVLVKKLETKDS